MFINTTVLTIIATILALATVATIATFATLYVRKQNAKKEQEEVQEYEEIMEDSYEKSKSQRLTVSDRIEVQVTNHKIHWITMTNVKKDACTTDLSYADFLSRREPTPEEKRQLDTIERHLARVREFRTEKVSVPVGYVIHTHMKHGEIIEYTSGMKMIGNSNKMAVVLERDVANNIVIAEIHLSYNLGVDMADVFAVTNKEQWELFLTEYGKDETMKEALRPEFERYNEMMEEITKFNKLSHLFAYNPDTVEMQYRHIGDDGQPEYHKAPRI